jgi:DUF1680 family protein
MSEKTQEFPASAVKIHDKFWSPRLSVNEHTAIFYQWEQLEISRCIDNFRILAQNKDTFREGWFFTDSDAYKWLDAAARILQISQDPKIRIQLLPLIDELIDLIANCQQQDGYIFSYNQIHFPKVRWKNLQFEHELYCIGHLIEAAINHFEATRDPKLLNIAEKAARLVISYFYNSNPKKTPGHQEIEIALIKLYRLTRNSEYLNMAENFLLKRGRIPRFMLHILGNAISTGMRIKKIANQRSRYLKTHPNETKFQLPGHLVSKLPHLIFLRLLHGFASGRYNQQHTTIDKQLIPEGHSVRYTYMQTAIAMLIREKSPFHKDLLQTLSIAWDHMVQKRMFVTGGIGSIPLIEGFGYDYELDPEYAYCETCAAIGSMLWNREMAVLTHDAKYDELLEWQLYNSVNSGMAVDGKSYLYRNPQISEGDLTREPWFQVPCCPSNVSRTLATIGQFIYSYAEGSLWIHQYIGSETNFRIQDGELRIGEQSDGINIHIDSQLPWKGLVIIRILKESGDKAGFFSQSISKIFCRIPGWTDNYRVSLNGKPVELEKPNNSTVMTASGYSPYRGCYMKIDTTAFDSTAENSIQIEFDMKPRLLVPHPKAQNQSKRLLHKSFIAYGPLVYCIENVDNPSVDIFHVKLDRNSLSVQYEPNLFNGTNIISCYDERGKELRLIPYFLWANRGHSKMNCVFEFSS